MNMAGTHEFNEVFFDNVRIPAQNLVGEENRGWYQAVTTLDIERSNIGSAVGQQQTVEDLIRFAKENRDDGVVRIKSDPKLRTELAERYLETEVAMSLSARVVSMQSKGMIPNYEAAAVKLYSMELNQRIANTGVRLMGMYGPLARGSKNSPMKGRMSYSYIRNVANTIEGGTSEVQRNIVAQRGLGLPRE
jgi:alkylation response protein AidB-like acyl-CoA dehydrogenase